ncbi:hypothetical protein S2M10_06760 [Sphingomonas sp. S2M10]|nr:hypothetical protein [Sphingomonas sp. S2M10]
MWDTNGTDVYSFDAQKLVSKMLKSTRFIVRVDDGRVPSNDGRFLPGNGEALAEMVFSACGKSLKI